MDKESKSTCGISGFSASPASPSGPGLRAPGGSGHQLIITQQLFDKTMHTLRERSAGSRESAAVWAGAITDECWEAQFVFFHHDLGNDYAGPLSLELGEAAKYRLYDTLHREQLRLIALIHTHPRKWVGLSEVYAENQLSSRIGFWSIVVPWYARRTWAMTSMGVHERTERSWHRLTKKEVQERFQIGGGQSKHTNIVL